MRLWWRRFLCRHVFSHHEPVLRDDMKFVLPGRRLEVETPVKVDGVIVAVNVLPVILHGTILWYGDTVCQDCGCRLRLAGSTIGPRELL